jgi:hypothetical protein
MERPPAAIVVLEENAAAQDLIEQSLRESGDRVLVSNNPMEALGLARRLRIDLIVGDAGLLEKTDPLVVKRLQGVGEMVYTRTSGTAPRSTGPAGPGCEARSRWKSSETPLTRRSDASR